MAYKKTDDYVEVADRIREFYERFPNGRITRHERPEVIELPIGSEKAKPYVLYTAAAYRSPEDEIPAIGTAWEPWPGPTPYTKDSEMMNAETAAWGRAIVAAGIPSKKIASKEEVQARAGAQKPSLEEALEGDSLVQRIKKDFVETVELPDDPLLDAFSTLDLGQQAWVIKKATGIMCKRDKSTILARAASLRNPERVEAIKIAKNLAAKKAQEKAEKEAQLAQEEMAL